MSQNFEFARQMSYALTQLCFRRLPAVGRRLGAQEKLSAEAYQEMHVACAEAVEAYIVKDAGLSRAKASLEEMGEDYKLWAPPEALAFPLGFGEDAEALSSFLLAGEVAAACEEELVLSDYRMAFLNKDVHARMHAALLALRPKALFGDNKGIALEHAALYVCDLEGARAFFETYLGGQSDALYHNPRTGFRSYFIRFDEGARLEIMQAPDVSAAASDVRRMGYIHLAFRLGSAEAVDTLTERLRADGYRVLSGPRQTGDGYYESCVLGFEDNQIELTV